MERIIPRITESETRHRGIDNMYYIFTVIVFSFKAMI